MDKSSHRQQQHHKKEKVKEKQQSSSKFRKPHSIFFLRRTSVKQSLCNRFWRSLQRDRVQNGGSSMSDLKDTVYLKVHIRTIFLSLSRAGHSVLTQGEVCAGCVYGRKNKFIPRHKGRLFFWGRWHRSDSRSNHGDTGYHLICTASVCRLLMPWVYPTSLFVRSVLEMRPEEGVRYRARCMREDPSSHPYTWLPTRKILPLVQGVWLSPPSVTLIFEVCLRFVGKVDWLLL